MAEESQLAIFEEDTPLTPIHSQAPTMHVPPPHVSPTGVPPAHRGASPTHLPPPASSGTHPEYSRERPSSAVDDRERIVVLESTVNQLATTMATNMAELVALLKGPNRASSSFTPPPGYGPAVDPNPWAQPTLIPDNGDTSAPTIVNAPAVHPVNNLPAPPSFSHPANLPAVTPVPSATMLEPPMLVPPPISTPVLVSVSASIPAPTSAVPPPIIFLPTTAQAPAHTAEPPLYQAPLPHIGLSYQASPPINIAYSEPGTPSYAAPRAPPTNFLPEIETEQERRMKRMEETIKALQAGDPRHSTSCLDSTLFPGMQLPPKVKVLDFQKYDGTTDPRHHLRQYRGKMLQYWDYEQFVIATF
ncbi:extensin-like [Punica granatum]|uniref:Extensin-like n=1 Tax=Punica granatum TaxID=22663 RepID=A0A6P8DJZ4_PUNGR|nr:extensin-like [Punica granatum]